MRPRAASHARKLAISLRFQHFCCCTKLSAFAVKLQFHKSVPTPHRTAPARCVVHSWWKLYWLRLLEQYDQVVLPENSCAASVLAAGVAVRVLTQRLTHRRGGWRPAVALVPVRPNASMVDTRRRAQERAQGFTEDLASVVQRLRSVPASRSEPVAPKAAAVLVPIFQDPEGRVRVLLTQRSTKLTTHKGEVCLPGGKRDPEDADDVATAQREAYEELGLAPSSTSIICQLRPFLSKHYLSVTPVVARIPDSFVPSPNPDEVAAVFSMPLASFLSSEKHRSQDLTWQGLNYRIHYFDFEGFQVWGLTAAMMISVAQLALGRPPAFQEHCDQGHDYCRLYHDGTSLHLRPPSPGIGGAGVAQVAPAGAAGASMDDRPHD